MSSDGEVFEFRQRDILDMNVQGIDKQAHPVQDTYLIRPTI